MAKKKVTGADYTRRGLKAVLVPVSAEQHHLITLAAGTTGQPVTRFAAAALEAAARQQIEAAKKIFDKI